MDGCTPPTILAWDRMRSKWNHVHGLTNVWSEPPVHGPERIKMLGSNKIVAHANQKPLLLMERQINSCTDQGDIVWEPFGGLCSASVAAVGLGRKAYAAEVNLEYFKIAKQRLVAHQNYINTQAN